MKNEALRRGAEEAPISLTGGMDEGRGVVSMRTCWLNLGGGVSWELRELIGGVYFGWRAAIVEDLVVGKGGGEGGCGWCRER